MTYYLPTIIHTASFARAASLMLDANELNTLEWSLIFNPEQGDIIPGLAGARKLRWGMADKGKRGGFRVVYYLKPRAGEIWLLAIYSKANKADLTPNDKQVLRKIVEEIKDGRS